jgi:hypothetical protein
MPIPEPGIFRPAKFIPPPGVPEKVARQAQLAALYGVSMQAQQLTETEIQQMRQLLAAHDADHKPMAVIDLNNPPKTPYKYHPFPKMVYDLQNSYPSRDEVRPRTNGAGVETVHVPANLVYKVVRSAEELEAALAEGWSASAPTFGEEREQHLSAQYSNESSRIDEQIAVKRGPGRPRTAA